MRNLKNYHFAFALLIGALSLSACNKINNDEQQPVSALTVINAFSGASSIDFFLDYNRVNAGAWNYKLNTGYFNIYPGKRNIKVSNALNTSQVFARADYNFPTGKFISLFIAPKLETNADSAIFVVAVDSLAEPPTGKASIRFVNLTPGARKIDVSIKDSTDVLFSDLAFNDVTDFVTINPSSNFSLEVREAGIDGSVKLHVTPFAVQAGKIYTVYSNGLWEGTGSAAFGASVLTNH